MICPPAAVAKAQMRGQVDQARAAATHVAATGAHVRVVKARTVAKPADPADATGAHDEHCCDVTPCSHCTGCGSCASMAASAELGAQAMPFATSAPPEPGGPRAEFLLSGQDRPPRAS
ncbi:hypothetical protein CDN99_25410 [Roseateles aquatilis]|uniref:Uncharacterized protein n=2 Tax=Roseateles aquatilis TaxID=431061 RepID=A0A246IUA1_9BURK|nr:hypothetical protein CDN99_25410 [Roseateles aquatilis]